MPRYKCDYSYSILDPIKNETEGSSSEVVFFPGMPDKEEAEKSVALNLQKRLNLGNGFGVKVTIKSMTETAEH